MQFEKFIIDQSPPDLNYGLLKTVPSSRNYSLMPWQVDQVSDIFYKEIENVNSIVDACAHIGVDSILFRLLYPYSDIVSIELNPNTFKALKENVDNLCQITGKYSKSIIVKNMDCLDYIYNHKADLMYFDPPWPENYKATDLINLSLSGQDLGDIINKLLKINPCLVVAKLPFNSDIETFERNVNLNINTYINYYTIYTIGKNPKISYQLAFIHLN